MVIILKYKILLSKSVSLPPFQIIFWEFLNVELETLREVISNYAKLIYKN